MLLTISSTLAVLPSSRRSYSSAICLMTIHAMSTVERWLQSLKLLTPAPGQQVIASIDSPVKASGGIGILRGNLAPDGCVVKLSGHERLQFRGPARVFESEEECFAAVQAQSIEAGDFIVIRYEGPAGGPGMREMLDVTAAIVEAWTKIRCTQLRVIAGHAK